MRGLIAVFLLLVLVPASATQTFTGQTEGGAFFTIQAPDDWSPAQGLVIYNHGFDIGPVDTEPSLGVLSEFLLEQGFAVAASSYRLNGWALFATAEDNQALYAKVVELLGEPERVIVFGGSLGSLVSVQAVERGGIGNVVAAYPVCGPLLGSDVWHQGFDLRLAYDVVCEGTSGELPGGAEGLPYALDPEQFDGILGDITAGVIGAAVSACTGLPLPPLLRSAGQQERLDRLVAVSGISESFIGLNMAYATAVLSDLVHDPDKLDGRQALGNANVVYADPDIDASILRVERDPFDHLFLKRAYTPTGRIGNTKLLITHTDKDDLVFVEHVEAYRARVPEDQLATAVVVEASPGHCAYTEAELVAGWEQLMDWVNSEVKPDAQSIQDHCQQIVSEGRYVGPCRYDPGFDPDARPGRFLDRGEDEHPVDARVSGAFYIVTKSGQGWFVEILEGGRAVVYWFTYDDQGQPIWIGGTGEVLDNAIIIDESWTTSGARFGDAFDSADVSFQPWGSLQFLYTEAGRGLMEYQGPEGFGSGREPIDQLIQLGHCPDQGLPLSGLWFDPARAGEGIILQRQADGRLFAAWFTYDPDGRQIWFFGEATGAQDGVIEIAMSRFEGPRFGPSFDPGDVVATTWGTLRVTQNSEDAISVAYVSNDPAYGSGSLSYIRLTRPLVTSGCTASQTDQKSTLSRR